MIGNSIEDEGAKAIKEMLMVNTTLTELNLRRKKKHKNTFRGTNE